MPSPLDAWTASAPYWRRHAAVLAQLFAPITEAMIACLDLAPEMRLLDVAGGAGEPALTLAPLLTHVTSVDGVEEMVAAAREQAAARRVSNVDFMPAMAEALPLNDESFHRVTCRLGLMFFSSPEAGLSEMLRVSARGGRICLATWAARHENPFFEVPLEVLRTFIEVDDPFRKGALRFDDPVEVEHLLTAAGGKDVCVRQVPFVMQASLTFDAWWDMRVEISSTLRACLEALPAAGVKAVREQVQRETEPWFTARGAAIPAAVIVATATR